MSRASTEPCGQADPGSSPMYRAILIKHFSCAGRGVVLHSCRVSEFAYVEPSDVARLVKLALQGVLWQGVEDRPMEETVASHPASVLRHVVCGAFQACRGGGGGGGGSWRQWRRQGWGGGGAGGRRFPGAVVVTSLCYCSDKFQLFLF